MISIKQYMELRRFTTRLNRVNGLYYWGVADLLDLDGLRKAGLIFEDYSEPKQRIPGFREYPYQLTEHGLRVLAKPKDYVTPIMEIPK